MNRIQPRMSPQAYKTYRIVAPPATHFRRATCREVDCRAYAFGWVTTIDVNTELGAQQANYIRMKSGRAFTVTEVMGMAVFTFSAGQTCFAQHTTRLDRPEIFEVRRGDFRGSTLDRTHANSDDWVDDFANHQDRIAKAIQEG